MVLILYYLVLCVVCL